MQRHTIRQVKLRLHLQQVEQVAHTQQEVNRIFKEEVAPELSGLFDELIGPDKFLRVPQLKIDLGTFSTELSPGEWRERCRVALREALLAFISGEIAHDNKQLLVPTEQRSWEAFLFFVMTGRLPWWFPAPEPEKWEFDILTALQDKSGVNSRRLIDLLSSQPHQFSRFIWQFSPAFLWSVLTGWWPQTKDFVAWLKTIVPGSLSGQGTAWRTFLQYLFDRGLTGNTTQIAEQLELLMERFQTDLASSTVSGGATPEQISNIWQTRALDINSDLETPTRLHPLPEDAGDKDASAESKPQDDAGIYVDNAGLVIIAPFIEPFFQGLGLVADHSFVSPDAQERGVALLRYLIDGREQTPEYLLSLEKILCGIPMAWPVQREILLTEIEKNKAAKLLTTAIDYWTALKQCSIAALQETFLQRKGKLLRREDGGWLLQPERKTVDILLDRLPWPYGIVKLPWMKEMVWVEW